jgi:hypothetical protein
MKNNNKTTSQISRTERDYKSLPSDALVNSEVVQNNQTTLGPQPKRKRSLGGYAQKISNDSFLFNV